MNSVDHQPSRVIAWMRLVRLPNVFTIIADVTAAFLLVLGTTDFLESRSDFSFASHLEPAFQYLRLIVAAVALYWAGMILNDVFDIRRDARLRASRPLPKRDISVATARRVGWCFLIIGVAVAGSLSRLSLGIAVLLAAMIVAYDGPGKRFWFAPLLMGGCRTLSFLLGSAAAWHLVSGGSVVGLTDPNVGQDLPSGLGDVTSVGLPIVCVAFAVGMGIYIVGITTFARREALGDRSIHLILGGLAMLAGGAVIATSPRWGFSEGFFRWSAMPDRASWRFDARFVFAGSIAIMLTPVYARAWQAIAKPSPSLIGRTIGTALLAIIPLSSVITFLAAGPIWAFLVFSLLLPSRVLAQKFALT